MKRFGLFMHIRKDGSKSKTEVICIPPLGVTASATDRDKVFVENSDQGYVTFNRRFTHIMDL
jgi:hypothetical protein